MKGTEQIKLLIDKEKKRVIFTESDGTFVDILFSFLPLTVGSVVRLLDSASTVGSADNLYNSAVNLDKKLLKTPECFDMLALSRSAFNGVKVRINNYERTRFYVCGGKCENNWVSTTGARCPCGESMSAENISFEERQWGKVKGVFKYIITDDLQVKPVSSSSAAFSLIKEIGVGESNLFEERILSIGMTQVKLILKNALLSSGPLTKALLSNNEATNQSCSEPITYPENTGQKRKRTYLEIHSTIEQQNSSKSISLKLVVCKSSRKILYAEGGADFVDFLFSFLTFPLGSIIKLLSEKSSIGCLDNLYKSVKDIPFDNNEISELCRKTFLDPKLPQHFKCSSQLLNVEEEGPLLGCKLKESYGRKLCFDVSNHKCKETHVVLNAVNPKLHPLQTTSGGGFTNDDIMYMITDTLDVKPLSLFDAMSLLNLLNLTVHDIEEQVVLVREKEGLNLLKASMTSKTVLNDVFAPNEPLAPKEER